MAMERVEKSGVQGDKGLKLNPTWDANVWFERAKGGAPKNVN